jgi:hypothetical protein
MKDSKKLVQNLLEDLSRTQEEEIDCDAVFDVLDVYAEAKTRGEDPSEFLPLVQQHFEICPCCREELEALLSILEADLS